MSGFVDNLNAYMEKNDIRQKYLSIRSGMSENKISKLLNSKQVIDENEMNEIAKALGKSVEYFLNPSSSTSDMSFCGRFAFYAGEPSNKQSKTANDIIELIENMDEILNSSSWYLSAGGHNNGIQ